MKVGATSEICTIPVFESGKSTNAPNFVIPDTLPSRLEPEFTTVALQAGDVLLLCTDGLTNAVPTEQLEQLLRSGSFYDLPDVLIRTANENGGPDNITALLVGVEPMEVRHG